MKLILKDSHINSAFLIRLSVFAAVFGLLGILLGDLFSAVCGGIMAMMISVKNKRSFTSAIIVAVILLTAEILINGFIPIMTIESVLIAIAISFLFKRGAEKSFVCSVLTVISVCILVLSFAFIAMRASSDYTFDAVREYYLNLYESIKTQFVEMVNQTYSSLPQEYKNSVQMISDEDVIAALDSAMQGLISYFVIFGFAVAGVALKTFCRVAAIASENESCIKRWNFKTSNLFCYFYLILMVAAFFIRGDSVLSIALVNVYNILTAVYLYIGLRFEIAILRTKLNGLAVNLIIIGQFVLLFAVVFRILPIMGAAFMIFSNRAHSNPENFSTNDT